MALPDSSASLNTHLCQRCRPLIDAPFKIGYPEMIYYENGETKLKLRSTSKEERQGPLLKHWPNVYEFADSALNGCHFCRLLWLQLTKDERNQILNKRFEKTQGICSVTHNSNQRTARYKLNVGYKLNSGNVFRMLKLHLNLASEQTCHFQGHRPSLDDMWNTALEWMTNCVTQHAACMPISVQPSSTRPSRLISVGGKDDFSDVKLCHKSEIEPSAAYFTLSHCWGPRGLEFKLLEDSLALFSRRIPWLKMPKTFQQSIIATRALGRKFGVKYLWIDALCIIQGSKEDWRYESTIMADIYENSSLNLAACAGNESLSDLFPERDEFSIHVCHVQPGPMSSLDRPLSVRYLEDSGYACENTVLRSRAWVIQELFLARRILYFTPHQLVWECPDFCANETEPEKALENIGRIGNMTLRNSPIIHSKPEGSLARELGYYMAWSTIIKQYTSCNLTNPSDKLVAISGLARRMHAGLGGTVNYVAGLWDRYLFLQLLWNLQQGSGPVQEYRAPSWSWASVDGQVYNHRTNDDGVKHCSPLVTIEVHIEHVTADPFGQIKAAELKITGPLLKVNLHKSSGRQGMPIATIDVDGKLLATRAVNLDAWPEEGQEAHLIFICLEKNKELEAVGLVLERVQERRGCYRRLGTFLTTAEGREDGMKWARSGRLPDNEYEEILAGEDYRIIIV